MFCKGCSCKEDVFRLAQSGRITFALVMLLCVLLVLGIVVTVVFNTVENHVVKLITVTGSCFFASVVILLTVPSPLPRYHYPKKPQDADESAE